MFYIKITGFELQISGLGSDRSTVSATPLPSTLLVFHALGQQLLFGTSSMPFFLCKDVVFI